MNASSSSLTRRHLLAATGASAALLAVPTIAAPARLRITEWVSDAGPLLVRSAVLEGPTMLGLVDTQFTLSNTMRLLADLKERGKPLAWVYVTHPHLDHFNGAALIRAAFPEARFYGRPEAIPLFAPMVSTRQASLGAAAPGGGANLPAEAPDFFEPLPESGLTLDDQPLQVLKGPGDHPLSSVVWEAESRTAITGDVVFSETHAFTGDHDDFDGWIDLIQQVQALDPSRVIVGHAGPAVRRGDRVLSEQIDWLETYRDARAEDPSVEHIKAVMTASYPGYANDFIFAFSAGVERL
ncbi:MAG: MBL fold metallo-hydrolase [Pseudomonadota bacterium]